MSKCSHGWGTETKQLVSGHFPLQVKAVGGHGKMSVSIKVYKSFNSLLAGRLIGITFGFYFCLCTISMVCVHMFVCVRMCVSLCGHLCVSVCNLGYRQGHIQLIRNGW